MLVNLSVAHKINITCNVKNDKRYKVVNMEILAISGSVRGDSYNTALLNAASNLSPEHINIPVFSTIQNIPIFYPDTDEESMPESVKILMARIRQADGVIISTPEYAHGITGVLKNALDWMVASDALVLKPVVVASVSTSGLGGVRSHGSLVLILSAMNSNVVVDGSLNVPFAKNKFDKNLNLIDTITVKALNVSLLALERAINHCT